MFLLFSHLFVTSQNLLMDMSSLQIIKLHFIPLLFQRYRRQDFIRLQNAAQKGMPSNCVSLHVGTGEEEDSRHRHKDNVEAHRHPEDRGHEMFHDDIIVAKKYRS